MTSFTSWNNGCFVRVPWSCRTWLTQVSSFAPPPLSAVPLHLCSQPSPDWVFNTWPCFITGVIQVWALCRHTRGRMAIFKVPSLPHHQVPVECQCPPLWMPAQLPALQQRALRQSRAQEAKSRGNGTCHLQAVYEPRHQPEWARAASGSPLCPPAMPPALWMRPSLGTAACAAGGSPRRRMKLQRSSKTLQSHQVIGHYLVLRAPQP